MGVPNRKNTQPVRELSAFPQNPETPHHPVARQIINIAKRRNEMFSVEGLVIRLGFRTAVRFSEQTSDKIRKMLIVAPTDSVVSQSIKHRDAKTNATTKPVDWQRCKLLPAGMTGSDPKDPRSSHLECPTAWTPLSG